MVSCCLDGDKSSCKGPYNSTFSWNGWLIQDLLFCSCLKIQLDCSPTAPEHAWPITVEYLNLHSRSLLLVLAKYKKLSYVTTSASAGTVSTDHLQMSYLFTTWTICSRKHPRGGVHRGQIPHPGCQSTLLRIPLGLGTTRTAWRESSGQSKSPTRSAPALIS